ncbi:MAG: hypothetical protein GY778_24445 [bacterium]|nr:hypothetical protein [bacterium]
MEPMARLKRTGRIMMPGRWSHDRELWRRLATLILPATALALAAVPGCSREDAEEDPSTSAGVVDQANPNEIPADVIRRLQSLPYTDYSSDPRYADRDGVIRHDPDRSYPGFNLYTARKVCRTDLIDEAGTVMRSWHRPGLYWEHGQLLPNGDLLIVGADKPPAPDEDPVDDLRFLLRLSWDDRLIWKRKLNVHHDVTMTPQDRFLTLGLAYRLLPEFHAEIPVRDDLILLLSSDGQIEERCSLYDAMSGQPDVFQFQKATPYRRWGRRMVDLFHSNSVLAMPCPELADRHPIYGADNILVCIRHQDTVAVINWTEKKLVWAWGQGELSGPHDASILPNGHMLIFDNGLGRDWSRIIELDPVSRKIVWQYKADPPTDFYTKGQGGNQRLPNGNTLIADSDTGRAFEVTTEGEIVWEFLTPHRGPKGERATIVRVDRYERDYLQRILAATDEGERASRD